MFKKGFTIRMIICISIELIIAAIHMLRIGSYLKGDIYTYYYSYASDIMVPFGVYFLISTNEIYIRFLRKWYVKALIVFGIATLAEIMQAFGVYLLGETFDVFDILMYAVGVMLAAFVDKIIFKRIIPNWKLSEDSDNQN